MVQAKKWIVAGLLLIGSPRFLAGQPDGVLTLRQCLDLARQNYPLNRAKSAQLLAEQQRLGSEKTEFLPTLFVGGQVNYGTNNSVTGAFFPNEGMSTGLSGGIRPENRYTGVFGSFGTLEVDWRVFNFGKLSANVAVNRSAVQVAQADAENELFQHLVRTTDAYLLTLVAEKISAVQERNLTRAKQIYEITRAEASSGLKAGTDSSFARAEVSKAKLLLLESQRNEQARRIRLAELMGSIENQFATDTAQFLNALPKDFTTDSTDLLQAPILKLYRSQMELGKSRTIAMKRSYAPSFVLTGIGWARGSGVSNLDDSYSTNFANGTQFRAYNYLAALSVRFNILNYSKVKYTSRAAAFEMERAQHLYDEAELKAQKQLATAEMELSLAGQQAQEAPIQLLAAKASYDQSRARYQSGLTSLAELAQSYYILNRAEVDKSIAINNVWRALLLKAAASGNLAPITDQIK